MGTITSNEELVKFVQSIMQRAHKVGDLDTITLLETALQSGYSSSEQLGSIRQAFTELMAKIDFDLYPKDTKSELTEAIKQINQSFRRANRPF
jgi:hypothetical protein